MLRQKELYRPYQPKLKRLGCYVYTHVTLWYYTRTYFTGKYDLFVWFLKVK